MTTLKEVAAMPLTMRVCYHLTAWNLSVKFKSPCQWAEFFAPLWFADVSEELVVEKHVLTLAKALSQKRKQEIGRDRALKAHAGLLAFVREQIQAEPSKERLRRNRKPSSDARPVCVRLVRNRDWLKMGQGKA